MESHGRSYNLISKSLYEPCIYNHITNQKGRYYLPIYRLCDYISRILIHGVFGNFGLYWCPRRILLSFCINMQKYELRFSASEISFDWFHSKYVNMLTHSLEQIFNLKRYTGKFSNDMQLIGPALFRVTFVQPKKIRFTKMLKIFLNA